MRPQNRSFLRCLLIAAGGILTVNALVSPARADLFTQTNLVSDIPAMAAFTDPNLRNPWGIVFTPTSPFWTADNVTGLATLYSGTGAPQPHVFAIPPLHPTGALFNPLSNFQGDNFIFATEEGTIDGWQGGTSALIRASTPGARYTGLAINTDANRLYAANFTENRIDAFDASYIPISLPGGFVDPTLPQGYTPFNIQNIGGKLYVTYVLKGVGPEGAVRGVGNGFVGVFDTNGAFLGNLVAHSALNAPWGMALAPAGFGSLGGDLLVGNFGDGRINAFDPTTGAFLGDFKDDQGNDLSLQGLWSLDFGNAGPGFDPMKLYFTAGLGGGLIPQDGLFGVLADVAPSAAVPEPGAAILLGTAMLGVLGMIRRRR